MLDPSDTKSLEVILDAVEAAEATKKKRNTKKEINFPVWDLNPGPSDYLTGLLTITPTGICYTICSSTEYLSRIGQLTLQITSL